MSQLKHLFQNNRKWASSLLHAYPHFFKELLHQQNPQYLWIGCADSRVPANEIVGLMPGELFVHRNVANLVIHTDMNCLSVLQYAIDHLKIRHIIICGHYGCGGVRAALEERSHGLVDNWLKHIKDIYTRHHRTLDKVHSHDERIRLLCELNVIEQSINVGNTTIVQDAWKRGQSVTIHGWIYDLADGLLKDLDVCVESRSSLVTLQRTQLRRSEHPGRSPQRLGH